jgi:hypothetical protein
MNKKIIFIVLFLILYPMFIQAQSRIIKLKITNPNSDSDCSGSWCQVYVEIPAKLYIDKGWLRSDLRNLRFNNGTRDLNYWVRPKKDDNLKINNLGLWLLVDNLSPNSEKYVNMIIDDISDVSFCNPGATSDNSMDRTSYNCAASVFKFYSFNLNDWKLTKYPSSNNWYDINTEFMNNFLYDLDTLWPGKSGNNAKTENKFTIHIDNMKFYDPYGQYYSEAKIYFLSQAPSGKPEEMKIKDGYMLYIKKALDFYSVSNSQHFTRRHFIIYLRKKEGGSWIDEVKAHWYPYGNSTHVVDIKVDENKIFLVINGRLYPFIAINGSVDSDGKYIRSDSFTSGFFGFNRMGWKFCCETDIDYIVLRKFFEDEPNVEVYGSTDLVVGLNSPNYGNDLIEITPDIQSIDAANIPGNTLDKYIFATFYGARQNQTIQNLFVKVKNRYSTNQTFKIKQLKHSVEPLEWVVYWCDSGGSNCSINNPDNVSLDGGDSAEYVVKVIPSPSILFNGGNLNLKIEITNDADASFDNGEFNLNVQAKLGCYWKYSLPITVTWNQAHGYSYLRNYQVLVEIDGVSELQYAKANGSDIIVTDGAGNIVNFWIKDFDKSNNKLKLWVKLPFIPDGDSTFYIWWGNNEYNTPNSNKKLTFDFIEDWESDYSLHDVVGCQDGTNECDGKPVDPHGWKNIPTPDDFYNWWEIDNSPDGTTGLSLQVDKGSSHKSDDTGPYIFNGKVAWDHYEVFYKMYTGEYDQFNPNTGRGNPHYNPVFVKDAGNMWGMEYFADRYIFRPYASGIDYVWQYQTYVVNIIGEKFPKRNNDYWVKVRVFYDKLSKESYLRVKIAKNVPSDIDKDSGFYGVANFVASPSFALDSGMIGFSGWDGGFYFDDIRVRKYVEGSNGNEPVCSPENVDSKNIRENLSLSQPQITPPFFNGRAGYVYTNTKPFSWLGDVIFLYADCYIGGSCKSGEDKDLIGTVSIFDKINDNTPKGLGYFLLKTDSKTENRSEIYDENWQENGRFILTYIDNSTNSDLNGFTFFDDTNCSILNDFLGTNSDNCSNTNSDTAKLIKFVRGYYISDFPKSEGRNMDLNSYYGDNDGIPEIKEQWKLGDILHSNPLIIGLPNMFYSDISYQEFINHYRDRPLVSYFMTNDGMLHAFEVARFIDNRYKPLNKPIELWAYIPQGILGRLKDTTKSSHIYISDGLLRAIDVYDSNSEKWRTILLGALGKGGDVVFSIDITNPEAPEFLWEINEFTNPNIVSKLGTTISSPAIGKVGDNWLAIFGSGYSKNFIENFISKKAYLTFVNIIDGVIEKQIKINDKIGNVLTNITSLRDVKTGSIKKIFFGDYYGALWRIDNETLNSLSDGASLSEEQMLFKPVDYDVNSIPSNVKRPITVTPVVAKGSSLNEWWVYFGTGDYNEYDSTYPYQRFYGVKDKPVTSGYTPYVDNVTCDNTTTSCGDFRNMTSSSTLNSSSESWVLELGHSDSKDVKYDSTSQNGALSTKDRNERVLQQPSVFSGFVFFTTFQPLNNPCGGGISRFYALKFNSGYIESNLFDASAIGNDSGFKTIRSLELNDSGISSKPMTYMGPGGKSSVTTTASVNSSSGELETIKLNPIKFVKNLDILLWRKIK